ncbi:MAG: trehalose-phosphatase [Gemmataceae bacterium]
MPHNWFDHEVELRERIRTAPQLALGLDYDGTLAPVTHDPAAETLPPTTRELLRELARRVPVAIISGRDLANLQERVRLPELAYAGNHGLEWQAPGGTRQLAAGAGTDRPELVRFRDCLIQQRFPGVIAQDKDLSLTIHTQAPDPIRGWVQNNCPAGFVVRDGTHSLDVRPISPASKGTAMRWLMEELAGPGSLAIYSGDDPSDEDAFGVANAAGGISIRVGRPAPARTTIAQYAATDLASLARFLTLISETHS